VTYRVFWAPFAEQRLEAILQRESDPSRIAAAARILDAQLARDPLDVGESRYDTVRIGFELPLGIQYEILHDVRSVIVYDVWRIDKRRRA
jgi:hypothetical protein